MVTELSEITEDENKFTQGLQDIKELHESLFWEENDPKHDLTGIGKRDNSLARLQSVDMENDAYIWCFVGPRGAGKSMGMTYYAARAAYLYNCRIVSNYPIAFYIRWIDGKKTYYEAEPLDLYKLLCFDRDYQHCLILMDEAPDIISHMAAMTWKNRLLNIFVRQLRKNMNSLFLGAQQFTLIDKSMRWQTDVLVKCQDAFRLYGGSQGLVRGACILLDLYDNSGQWTGHGKFINHDGELSIVQPDDSLELGSKPLWGVYDTYYQQDIFESLRRVDMDLGSYQVGDGGDEAADKDRVKQLLAKAMPVVLDILNDGKQISSAKMYRQMGIVKQREKSIVGQHLGDCGMETSRNSSFKDFTNFDSDKFIAMVEG